jgi:hypothetical protein
MQKGFKEKSRQGRISEKNTYQLKFNQMCDAMCNILINLHNKMRTTASMSPEAHVTLLVKATLTPSDLTSERLSTCT